jgi:protein-S-isoprenylcysteine O-methyltransferase Ste14
MNDCSARVGYPTIRIFPDNHRRISQYIFLRTLPIVYFLALGVREWMAVDWRQPTTTLLGWLSLGYIFLIIINYLRQGMTGPIRRGDFLSQVVAVIGANCLVALSVLPTINPGLELIALGTDLIGIGLSLWAAWYLGACFSLAPEVRGLVRQGPYRWVRHPLYTAGFIIGVGLLAIKLSPAALGLFLGFVLMQVARIYNEEHLLAESIPEYSDYRQATRAILPFVI